MSDVVARIAAVVLEHSYYEDTGRCYCGLEVGYGDKYDQGYEKWAAHVAGVVAEALHPTITTVEQLDALPPESVIRLDNGLAAWKRNGLDWYIANDEDDSFPGECIAMNDYALPATVLFTPEGQE